MAITLGQQAGVRSSGAVVSVPFASQNALGALLTLATGGNSTIGVASTVTDSAGNTWLLAAVSGNATQSPFAQQWYAVNAVGGTNTVQVTNVAAASQIQCAVQEWSGVVTTSPLVATSTRSSTVAASTHTPGSVSPSQSSALFFVTYSFASNFDIPSAPSGYSTLISTFASMNSFYKITSGSTTTEDPQAVSSAAEVGAHCISVFSGVEGGGPATAKPRRFSLQLLGAS